MGGGDGGIGGQAGFPLETWFWEMPLCTRWWTTATVLTSALVQCQIVTPFQLFYSFRAVFVKSQVRCQPIPNTPPSDPVIVLATPYDLPLLRSAVSRSRLPRLLPYSIFPITRRIIGSITCALFLVTTLRNDMLDMPFAISIDALPWTPAILDTCVHLVKAQPRHTIEFPGPVGFHSSISALGTDGIQPGVTWNSAEG